MSRKILLSLHFIFHICSKTNEQCLSSAQTGQVLHKGGDLCALLFSFSASFRHEIENALSGAPVSGTKKVWHQKSMTD